VFVRIGVMLLGIVLFVAITGVVQIPLRAVHVEESIGGLIVAAVSLAIYVAWVRFVERRPPDEVGLATLPQVVTGIALGVALLAATVGIIALAGAYTVLGAGNAAAAADRFLPFVATGVAEEIVFRGYLFRVVRDVGGTWIGVIVSALVFGALHAFNPGATPASSVAIALEAGVLLALAYAATNSLWLPIGIHIGWNFAEGPIFGSSVSGVAVNATVLRANFHGPAWLTGGAFGPEASVVAVFVCLVASAVLAALVVRRERRSAQLHFLTG